MAEKPFPSHLQRNPCHYPLWQFQKDVLVLKEEAEKFGLDSSYPEGLLESVTNKPKDGVLLWYYKDYTGFTIQWCLINGFLLIIFWILFEIRKRISKMASILNKVLAIITLNILLLAVNGWAFAERPLYIPYTYWIIPFVTFLLCFVLISLNPKTERDKR